MSTTPRPWFQSSPALSSGRYKAGESVNKEIGCFNPRPPFRAGATDWVCALMGETTGFNPRPPFRAGATVFFSNIARGCWVSILARPFERALRG